MVVDVTVSGQVMVFNLLPVRNYSHRENAEGLLHIECCVGLEAERFNSSSCYNIMCR